MPEGVHRSVIYVFDRYQLVPMQRSLRHEEMRVELTPRVFDLLLILVERFGDVVTKDELLDKVWGDAHVEEGNINRTVSTLRKNLGKQLDGSDFIETVPKVGYRFIAPVVVEEANDERSIHEPNGSLHQQDVLPIKTDGIRFLIPVLVLIFALIVGFVAWRYLSNGPNSVVNKPIENGIIRLTQTQENEQVAGWTTDGRIVATRWKDVNTPETVFLDPESGNSERPTNPADVRQGIWSPDGSHLVYSKVGANREDAFVAKADGTESTKLPFKIENAVWAPDGSGFAFQSNSNGSKTLQSVELMVYSIADGKIAELTSNTSFDGDPGWSPDGKRIAFTSDRSGNYEIYTMNSDGSGTDQLTNNRGHDSFPKFSPDGTQIVFNSNLESEKTDVYIMNADGGNPIRLTDWKSNELSRNGWSPDGTRLAFNSDIEGNDEIYVMNVEPFKPALLLEDANAELQTPSYSPDGIKVVFTAEIDDRHFELLILDLQSKKSKLLLSTTSPQNYPRWSSDGQWIAFHQEVDGKWDIFKVRPDGTGLLNLTNDPSSDSLPTWSDDGSTIYFRSNRNGDTENSELFRMNSEGSGQTLLPIKKGKLGWSSVSTKGDEIVFAADREANADRLFDIYAAEVSSGNERLIASRSKNDVQSSFAHDGSKAAFVASSDGNQEIYVVNRDSSGSLRLTRNIAADLFPAFSFDGSKLVFSSNRNGKFAIYEILLAR